MYQQQIYENNIIGVYKTEGKYTINIPFAPANTDFMQFKHDLSQGVELQDANGVVMTADQIKAFEATLP